MTLEEILSQKNKKLTDIYFELQIEAENKYGKNTIILLEVGSFYEIYEANNIGKAREFSKLLNIQLTKKNKKIQEVSKENPYMCGMPTVSFDKHIERITLEEKWTVVLVKQVGEGTNIERKIEEIISPGTNISSSIENNSGNYIASIYLDFLKNGIIHGCISFIDITTGKTLIYESYGTKDDKLLAVDEIYSLTNSYNIKEYLIITENYDKNTFDIEDKFNLKNKSHIIKKIEDIPLKKDLSFQNNLLKKSFKINSMLSSIEYLDLEKSLNLSTSLTLLLEYIIEHNVSIIYYLKLPEKINNSEYLYLGNNCLEQLNISTNNKDKDLIYYIDNAKTAIGKRYINYTILNPITNVEILNQRYNDSDLFCTKKYLIDLNLYLDEVYDIERLFRKIITGNSNPNEILNIYSSLVQFFKIYKYILNNKELKQFSKFKKVDILKLKNFYETIKNIFDLSKIENNNTNSMKESFFNPGIDKDIDNLQNEITEKENLINKTAYIINKYICIALNKPIETDNFSYIKIGHNDRDGYFVELTKNRFKLVKSHLDNIQEQSELRYTKELIYKELTGTYKIVSKELENISEEVLLLENRLNIIIKDKFKEITTSFNEYTNAMEEVIIFIGYLEFCLSNALLNLKFSYCKPEIINLPEESFLEVQDLRHPIIERIEEKGIYVPNDIVFGNKNNIKYCKNLIDIYSNEKDIINGILLYGINSSGKSSYMKSVGISLILAQSGFFTPAKHFRFSPYEYIFTRISGDDNIYKGLSTFAVEMIELRNIFNRVNGKSLVLGDEISHGTETISGTSIVAATIINLDKRNSNFIFATHLHQLNDIEEIQDLNSLVSLHLKVEYDSKTDKLIYNRKLRSGSGSSVYGLEFAKYLKLDDDFLKTANSIRKKIAPDLEETELITEKKPSSWNKNVYITRCGICNKNAEEIHHIKDRKSANEFGLTEHHRINHEFNLVPLCKKHHLMVHNKSLIIRGYLQTTKGFILDYDLLEKNT